MIRYLFNRADEIVYASFVGEVGLNDIKIFYNELTGLDSEISYLRILQDEQKAIFTETSLIFENGRELVEILAAHFPKVKIAVLQDRAIETAYSSWFVDRYAGLNIKYKIFSLDDNAVMWLRE